MSGISCLLDRTRWIGLWSRLGGRRNGHSVFERLAAAYAEPTRTYHNAEHIRVCLAEFDKSRDLARHPDEVEAALWFHDAVYVPAESDNEEQSARLAESTLRSNEVPADTAQRIAELVRATRHVTIPQVPDAQLVCDIDLSILGRAPDQFDRFERQIRREYAAVPEQAYRLARAEVLTGLLHRASIYQLPYFRDRYEARARENLTRVLGELAPQ